MAKLNYEARRLRRYDKYLEGEQPLQFVAPEIRSQVGDRVTELVLNWPRFGVEAYDNRLDIEGFRYAGQDSSDEDLWQVWQANDGGFISQQAHQEHLAMARAYIIVGEGDDPEVPLITAESPFNAIHLNDPRTHDINSGLKTWIDLDRTLWSSIYTTEGRTTWRMKGGDWVEDSAFTHDWGICQIVPLVNQPRILGRYRLGAYRDRTLGRSIFHDIIPIADAANKMVTDMMVSGEFHAMPRRWATGLQESDFQDEEGNQLDTFAAVAGAMWATEDDKAKFGQFPEADLSVFHNSIKLLAQLASQLLALPPNYLNFVGDNPPSADAIRASEVQLVKRAERMQSVLSTRWRRVQRLVLLTRGNEDAAANQIETLWRDPSTPTMAQKSDAVTKLVQSGVIPKQQAWEDLGYTAVQQERMADWFAQNQADPQITAATRQLQLLGTPTDQPTT